MSTKSQLRAFSGAYSSIDFAEGIGGAILAKSLLNLSQAVDSLSDDGQKALTNNMQCHWEFHSTGGLIEGSPLGISFGILQTAGTVTSNQVQTTNMFEHIVLGALTDDVFGYQRITNPKYTSIFWKLDINDGQGDRYHYYKANGSLNIPRNVLALLNKESETERLQDLYLVVLVNTYRGVTTRNLGLLQCSMTIDYSLKRQTIKVR